ncbi:type II toxin-antitoxin system Phd/YefM family antitoxin [Variovorax sp. UC122_21]|uniref:type II toxin-antitoxin system Phd/YefM family antitoxin n=1 Tax=Variovorax TaxID=34072 RepID=UPI0019345B5F|nr:hypothetical protein INQ48_33380 [Variovorax paradoxus]
MSYRHLSLKLDEAVPGHFRWIIASDGNPKSVAVSDEDFDQWIDALEDGMRAMCDRTPDDEPDVDAHR